MDMDFIGDKDKFIVIYLDDITMFSKSDKELSSFEKGLLEVQKIWSLSKS